MRKKSLIVSIFILDVQIQQLQVIQVAGIQRAIQKTTHQMTIKTIQKIVNHKKIIQQTIINQKKQQIQQL